MFRDTLLFVRSSEQAIATRSGVVGLLGLDFMRAFDWSFRSSPWHARKHGGPSGVQQWIGLGVDLRIDDQDPGRVVGLAETGPAALAGLMVGDRITTMNGEAAIPSNRVAFDAVGNCGCIEDITVVFERVGRRTSATISTAALI
nr:hypothetical protein [Brevundimonas subvibrioides]